MSLLDLPNELLLSVAGRLRCLNAINVLACTNRRLYILLNAFLYEYYVQTSDHSALPWAAGYGLTNTVLKFLKLGANVGATLDNDKRATSLHLASRNGHLLIVEALIQNGSEADAETSQRVTPLHEAVRAGHEHVTRVLLENGADFMKTLPIPSRPTILHVASYYGFTDIVHLLERGMGIQVRDRELQTPLHYAVMFDKKHNIWHGNLTTVNFLLENKAVRDSWDRLGRRPKDIAERNPDTVIQLLLQHTTNTTLNDAILLDQAIQNKRRREKELEERVRKMHELAAERIARLVAREAEKKAKERLLMGIERSVEHQDRIEEKRLLDISREEKIYAIRERWCRVLYA